MSNQTLISIPEFELIFEKWNKKVYQYALSKTSSAFIAEETVQRVFIKLWDNLFHKNIAVDIEAQIFCIARTTLLDVVKEERKRQIIVEIRHMQDEVPTPSELYRLKEMNVNYKRAVERMPASRREVFLLSRLENLSYKEIADRLSISPKTVENHIALALKALKKTLFILYIIFFLK
ncbi:sigma-70 family RNA polymerase sigma factor [Sphingobacterium spiritivorum]|uniref:sigma-70 family RNA polymerase sigma factor n=1 Tax=Sphingobacterium spiritivorum TaxID=258 RepID=UPI0019186C8E|nr:sigma-70 family RNA polymerase sigma factor [Sphingobacterium spiritivorum]QQT24276.1 sigma-70 family RNA polymerase sigma factor [Sphingobacterium spiritivorum]